MPMTQREFRIVPCLAGENASATCLKMLVMRLTDVPAPLSLLLHFAAQYKVLVIIIKEERFKLPRNVSLLVSSIAEPRLSTRSRLLKSPLAEYSSKSL